MIQNNTVKVTLKIRHDITENWSENNPILAIGEFGLDDSTSLLKIGNGITHWNELPYLNKIDNTKLKHLSDGSLTFSDEFLEELAQAGIGPLQPGSIRDADVANDANIAQSKISGLTTVLAEKAPLNNPTFTGTVTVPTPTNNTDAATKAYVDTAAASANTTYNISWSAIGTNAEKLVLTPTTNGVSGTQQTVNLKKVATTADIYDLENAVTKTV